MLEYEYKSLSLGITRITFEPWEGRPAAPENQLWSEEKKLYHFKYGRWWLFCVFVVAHPSIHPEVDKWVDTGVSEGEEEENCVDVTN